MCNKLNKVVGIGEVLWDILPSGKKIGGAPANFAFHSGQFGLDSIVVSAVGNDLVGKEIIESFQKIGLRHRFPIVDYPTGTVTVSLDSQGIPQYDIHKNVAWDHIPFSVELSELAEETAAVCFGSLAQRSEESRRTIRRFVTEVAKNNPEALTVFDGNLRQDFYSKEILADSIAISNVLKINDEELNIFGSIFNIPDGDLITRIKALRQRYGLKILIVTCGTYGSYVVTADELSFLPTPRVVVADTVGAGDSFTAAFISGILKGRSITSAHQDAVETSAFVCSCHGAMPVLPENLTK